MADPEGGEKIKIKIKINEIWTKVFYHLTQETNASKLGTARLEYHVSRLPFILYSCRIRVLIKNDHLSHFFNEVFLPPLSDNSKL